MRHLALAAVLLTVAAPPAAAAPVGAPDRIGAARAADHRDKPGAFSEWWTLRLLDPRSEGWLEIVVAREYTERHVTISGVDRSGAPVYAAFAVNGLEATTRTLEAGGQYGGVRVRDGRHVRVSGPQGAGTIRLRARRRGPAAYGWRLGEDLGPAEILWRPVTLSWAIPVATSRARGALVLAGGRRLEVGGWRASYEHAWGDMMPDDTARDFWDQIVVHGRGGRAWVAYGLNRRDTVTGPGARDAQWLGILARVGGDGRLRVCRPRVRRTGWEFTYPDFARWSTRLSFACRGVRLRVRDDDPVARDRGTITEIRSRIRGRRTGFSLHVAVNVG